MTLEELFSEVEVLGLYVNNLFQRHDGKWQANLRDGQQGYEFGRGDTPVAAMRECIDKARTERHVKVNKQQDYEDLV
jgi:hypothetical protein